jgi:aminobenzoyl-glutamate utilization protein B
MSALGGALAMKAAMERHHIAGTLKLFGEPAEKLRASKPIHAAKGYYAGLDAAVSFHPHYFSPLCNTAVWDTHCGVGYNYIYTFTCDEPENWIAADRVNPIPQNHLSARAPGANDALVLFYHLNEGLRRSMLPATGLWSFNEAILTAGQATADNLAPHLAQIDYMVRTDSIAQADIISAVMDNNAEAAAKAAFCGWQKTWVSKSRGGKTRVRRSDGRRGWWDTLARAAAAGGLQGAASVSVARVRDNRPRRGVDHPLARG